MLRATADVWRMRKLIVLTAAASAALAAAAVATVASPDRGAASAAPALAPAARSGRPLESAIVAGGCFWSVESNMEAVPGVVSAVSGYAGGDEQRPTYEQVSHGGTGHLESVKVTYDPGVISYDQLLRRFMRTIDPTDPSGQFCDQGPHYRTAVFVRSERQRAAAQAVKAETARELGKPVTTMVLRETAFWPAEAYHQDYARRNRAHYTAYKIGCGRDRALRAVWGGQAATHS